MNENPKCVKCGCYGNRLSADRAPCWETSPTGGCELNQAGVCPCCAAKAAAAPADDGGLFR